MRKGGRCQGNQVIKLALSLAFVSKKYLKEDNHEIHLSRMEFLLIS